MAKMHKRKEIEAIIQNIHNLMCDLNKYGVSDDYEVDAKYHARMCLESAKYILKQKLKGYGASDNDEVF